MCLCVRVQTSACINQSVHFCSCVCTRVFGHVCVCVPSVSSIHTVMEAEINEQKAVFRSWLVNPTWHRAAEVSQWNIWKERFFFLNHVLSLWRFLLLQLNCLTVVMSCWVTLDHFQLLCIWEYWSKNSLTCFQVPDEQLGAVLVNDDNIDVKNSHVSLADFCFQCSLKYISITKCWVMAHNTSKDVLKWALVTTPKCICLVWQLNSFQM